MEVRQAQIQAYWAKHMASKEVGPPRRMQKWNVLGVAKNYRCWHLMLSA